MENDDDPQRVPDLVLWEPELRIRQVGDDVLLSWPRRDPGDVYVVHSTRGGQAGPPGIGTSRLVPRWRIDGDLVVEIRSQDGDVRYLHHSARKTPPSAERGPVRERVTLAGRSCVAAQGHNRVVLKFGSELETSDDGVTFEKIVVPQPKWGLPTMTVNAKYVCGRDVEVW